MSELRECPFCGSVSAQVVCDIADWPSVVCSVHEGGCGASSGHCSSGSRKEAVEAWNTRASDRITITDKGRELLKGRE